MAKKKNPRRRPTNNNGGNGGRGTKYELTREQRIKENQLRMEKLGLLKLNLKPSPPPPPPPRKRKQPKPPPQSSSPRRSSRLRTDGKENVNVENLEINNVSQDSESEDSEPEPEVYTEEHVKLLGDCKTSWELHVDGFDEDGNRTHSSDGKCCHHCRYKIAGHITECSKCKSIQGQLCGDCLYTRYGENVMEANENKDWVCPACRGICNCSVCRRAKGWKPTGTAITYPKVASLGFKSVAHYLIQTRRPNSKDAGPSPISREKSLPKLVSRQAAKKTGTKKVARKRHDHEHTGSDSEPDDEEEDDDIDLNEDADDYDYEPEENDGPEPEENDERDVLADGLVVESECLV